MEIVNTFIEGVPYPQKKKRGAVGAAKVWSEGVIRQTKACQKAEGQCKVCVEFILRKDMYPPKTRFGTDLDNLLKRLFDALGKTVFSQVESKDGCVTWLEAKKRKAGANEKTGVFLVIDEPPEISTRDHEFRNLLRILSDQHAFVRTLLGLLVSFNLAGAVGFYRITVEDKLQSWGWGLGLIMLLLNFGLMIIWKREHSIKESAKCNMNRYVPLVESSTKWSGVTQFILLIIWLVVCILWALLFACRFLCLLLPASVCRFLHWLC